MKHTEDDLIRVSHEAAMWLLRLEEDESVQTRAEFDRWIRQGPVYLEEFYFAQMMFAELDRLDSSFRLGLVHSLDSVVEFPSSSTNSVSPQCPAFDEQQKPFGLKTRATHAKPSWMQPGWLWGLAASIVIAVALLSAVVPSRSVYATETGSQESIKLEDGSVIHLNTNSKAAVRFSNAVREVRLLRGEALFDVAHDATRPFIVVSGDVRLRAVGTRFNVYQRGADQTRVSVLDGIVQVSVRAECSELTLPCSEEDLVSAPSPVGTSVPRQGSRGVIRLAAGDEAAIVGSKIVKEMKPDVARAVAWRARRLVFSGNSIAEIANEFNRYSKRQIRVEGQLIRERRMTAVFDADDPSPLIDFLTSDPAVEVIRGQREILIRPRERPES